MVDYVKEGLLSARACARAYGIKDKADIATIAKQFEYDLRKHDELHALAEGQA
jgi:hypothetical protein